MEPSIIPAVRSLYLCDHVIGSEKGKVDLFGLFNSIRAESFPCLQPRICVYAQLVNGLGEIPFVVEIRNAATDEVTFVTHTHNLFFPNRTRLVHMVQVIKGCLFEQAGVYTVELICKNQWMTDTIFRVS